MMKTLIIPCAGKSNRFPNMKPKYMLTHPDGKLMVEKAIEKMNIKIFDRIIITIVKPHDEKYESKLIMEQVFKSNPKIEICMLDDFTWSASETINLTLEKMNVSGSIVIKDSDNCVHTQIPDNIKNAVVWYDLRKHPDISNIPWKSFLVINEQNIIQDIIEKDIVSNIICLWVYSFENCEDFKWAYNEFKNNNIQWEMYISHIISYLIAQNKCVFECNIATWYDDRWTLIERKQLQKNCRTYFVDFDWVLIKNSGRYGTINWHNNKVFLEENIQSIIELQNKWAQIVITTSRTEEFRKNLEEMLDSVWIKPYVILMWMNHAARVIINDFATTNPYPSWMAITLPRNSTLKDYLS